MQTQTAIEQNIKKAKTLLQQGYIAYNNWEINKARLLWRKAAVCDPANEEIWQALFQVTQTDEDRKVCLQNILVLNPDNAEAEQRLRLLENDTQPTDVQDIAVEYDDENPIITDTIVRIVSWSLTFIIGSIIGILMAAILIQAVV